MFAKGTLGTTYSKSSHLSMYVMAVPERVGDRKDWVSNARAVGLESVNLGLAMRALMLPYRVIGSQVGFKAGLHNMRCVTGKLVGAG